MSNCRIPPSMDEVDTDMPIVLRQLSIEERKLLDQGAQIVPREPNTGSVRRGVMVYENTVLDGKSRDDAIRRAYKAMIGVDPDE